jgi:hypothetical protein
VDQVDRPCPFVPLHRWFGIQIVQAPEPHSAEIHSDNGEGRPQQAGSVSEVEPLAPQLHGSLQLSMAKRLPLGAADAAPIRQRGGPAERERAGHR